ncbi:MAG: OmpH family outer membrane protein [candidate division WOR-3 bacterium]
MFNLFFLFFFLISFLLSPLWAKETKIGYLDMERILAEYEGAKEAKRELEKEIEKYRLQIDSLRKELTAAREEFATKRLMLTSEGKKAEEERIEELERRYKNFLDEVWGERGKISLKNQELLAPIIKKVAEAIEKVAKEGEFSMVLDASQNKILYAQPGLDITDNVLAELRREAGILPLLPPVEKKFALLSISELSPEAREDNLGVACLTYLYQLFEGRKKVKLIEKGEVERVLSLRTLKETDRIEKDIVYELGRELGADYCLLGTVNKSGKRITVEITYFDIEIRKEFPPLKVEMTKREDLKSKIGEIVKKVLKATVGE